MFYTNKIYKIYRLCVNKLFSNGTQSKPTKQWQLKQIKKGNTFLLLHSHSYLVWWMIFTLFALLNRIPVYLHDFILTLWAFDNNKKERKKKVQISLWFCNKLLFLISSKKCFPLYLCRYKRKMCQVNIEHIPSSVIKCLNLNWYLFSQCLHTWI